MKDLEKLTKDKLITIINEQEKRLYFLESKEQQSQDLENQLNLLKYLYEDYVPTKRENEMLRLQRDSMNYRIQDLRDLCDRQQKIIDSGCN